MARCCAYFLAALAMAGCAGSTPDDEPDGEGDSLEVGVDAPAEDSGGTTDGDAARDSDVPADVAPGDGSDTTAGKTFNEYILDAVYGFGGTAAYFSTGSGVTRDVLYQGELVARAAVPPTCHCVGASWQAYMEGFALWSQANDNDSLGGLTWSEVRSLQHQWYGEDGHSITRGAQGALVNFGLGVAIDSNLDAWHEQLQAGDPIAFHRGDDSFHSVIFLRWLEGDVMEFFSCNLAGPGIDSDPIGFNVADGSGQFDAAKSFAVHPLPPDQPGPRP